jgi:hypothetical protein
MTSLTDTQDIITIINKYQRQGTSCRVNVFALAWRANIRFAQKLGFNPNKDKSTYKDFTKHFNYFVKMANISANDKGVILRLLASSEASNKMITLMQDMSDATLVAWTKKAGDLLLSDYGDNDKLQGIRHGKINVILPNLPFLPEKEEEAIKQHSEAQKTAQEAVTLMTDNNPLPTIAPSHSYAMSAIYPMLQNVLSASEDNQQLFCEIITDIMGLTSHYEHDELLSSAIEGCKALLDKHRGECYYDIQQYTVTTQAKDYEVGKYEAMPTIDSLIEDKTINSLKELATLAA